MHECTTLCFSLVLPADKLKTGSQKQVEAMARKWADLYDSDPSSAQGQLLHLLLQVRPLSLSTAAILDSPAFYCLSYPPYHDRTLQPSDVCQLSSSRSLCFLLASPRAVASSSALRRQIRRALEELCGELDKDSVVQRQVVWHPEAKHPSKNMIGIMRKTEYCIDGPMFMESFDVSTGQILESKVNIHPRK